MTEVDSFEELDKMLDETLKSSSSVINKKKRTRTKKTETSDKNSVVVHQEEKGGQGGNKETVGVEKEEVEHDEEDDEDLRGLDPNNQPYFPMSQLPREDCFASRRLARSDFMEKFFGTIVVDGVKDLNFPIQSMSPNDPVKLPIVVRFNLVSPYQLVDEGEDKKKLLKKPIYLVIAGIGKDKKDNLRVYSFYSDGISYLWDHYSHVTVDKDEETGEKRELFVPFCTISAAGRLIYGNNCNGWKNFVISDTTSFWHNKTLDQVRSSNEKLGIEFENTLPEDVLENWNAKSASYFNDGAMFLINFVKLALKDPGQFNKNKVKEENEESDEPKKKKKVVKKRKTTKTRKLTRREQVEKALQTSSVDQSENVDEHDEEEGESGSETSSRAEQPVVRDAPEGQQNVKRKPAGKQPMHPPQAGKKLKISDPAPLPQKGVKKPLLGYDPQAPSSEIDQSDVDSDLEEDDEEIDQDGNEEDGNEENGNEEE